MSNNKKYYYIKLKHNYFDQDNIKVLESLPNGHIYSLIIIKLYLKATKHGGQLKMTDTIPYDPKNVDVLANVINHDIAHVKEAIKFGMQFDLITIVDSGDIWMTEIQNMIGQSSSEGDRKRAYRAKLNNTVLLDGQMSDKCPPEKELEKKIDTEPKKEKITVPVNLSPTLEFKLKEFIKYRKVIKHPLKTNRSLESMVKKIGKDFINEDHLIKCIDFTMDNEYQGVRSEYVKYVKPISEKPVVVANKKHITTMDEAKSNPEFQNNDFNSKDFMNNLKIKKVN